MPHFRFRLKAFGFLLLTLLLLPVLLIVALYLPPVQRWAVDRVSAELAERMGMQVEVEHVRLTPFFHLVAERTTAIDHERDTLLRTELLDLDVAFRPLWSGRIDVEGIILRGARLNSKSLISDVRVQGRVDELRLVAHGVAWREQRVHIDRAHLMGADLWVTLSDTARPDTAKTPLRWVVELDEAQVRKSVLHLALPGDSLHLRADLGETLLRRGRFDLGHGVHQVAQIDLRRGAVMMNAERVPLPAHALFDVQDVALRIDSFRRSARGAMTARLVHASAREVQRGLAMTHLSGTAHLSARGIHLPVFRLRTPDSQLSGVLRYDFNALRSTHPTDSLELRVEGSLHPRDLLVVGSNALPAATLSSLHKHGQRLWADAAWEVRLAARGRGGNLSLTEGYLRCPGVAQISLSGRVASLDAARPAGDVRFHIVASGLRRYEFFLPSSLTQAIRLPEHFQGGGIVKFQGRRIDSRLSAQLEEGRAELAATVDLAHEDYRLSADFTNFPLQHLLRGQPLSPFTGTLTASGKGFQPAALRTHLVAEADLRRLTYDRYPLDGLRLDARMHGSDALIHFTADNPALRAKGAVVAQLRRRYDADLDVEVAHLDLRRWAGLTDTVSLGGKFVGRLQCSPDFFRLSAAGKLSQLRLLTPDRGVTVRDIDFTFRSAVDSTRAHLASGDLRADFSAAGSVQQLGRKASHLSAMLERKWAHRQLDLGALRSTFPTAQLLLTAGDDNPLASFLRTRDCRLRHLDLDLTASAEEGLNGQVNAGRFEMGALLIDTLHGNLHHDEDTLRLRALVRNDRATNPNPFEVQLSASLSALGAGGEISFADGKGDVGLRLGADAELAEGGYRFHLRSGNPVVAYRNFTINPDNYVFLGDDRTFLANVRLVADDGTGIQINGERGAQGENDLSVNLRNVNLGELAKVFPYLPPMGGRLSGDFHLVNDHRSITATGMMEAADFAYQNVLLGRIGAEVAYMPKSSEEHYADAFISFNGDEVAELSGTYRTERGGHFDGMATLKGFPLRLLNGFMDGTDFLLRGAANGSVALSGAVEAPVIEGSIALTDGHLYSPLYGVDFTADARPIVLHNSQVSFDRYALRSTTTDALTLDGTVDLSRLEAVRLDLAMEARNFALINAPRQSGSLLFGKVYGDYSGTVRGTLDRLFVRGTLDVLPRTDATYLLTNSPLSVQDELAELVSFTDFSDTVTTAAPVHEASALDLSLAVNVRNGARFHCFLSPNGESYVDVSGEGNLVLRMTRQGEQRLTGRLTLDEGTMNYELPIIPLRAFTLEGGSYVEFKGDPFNPTLNITASDRVKAVVTERDRQRTVSFIAGVVISRTLSDMGLEFTIEAPEDLSIQNQLATMSVEDRGKAAVALLATGMYITDDNLASGGLKASNALNAFLQNEIQNIAGRALSTIDLSFGMENGISASGATTTDYNFRFSKRFLNNRMRVVVGGKVSTGTEAATATQSFIDNIALEYRLDTSGARYVRVFYDRDAQDPLEGSLMKTGAGIVLHRKSDRIGELFLFRRKKEAGKEKNPVP